MLSEAYHRHDVISRSASACVASFTLGLVIALAFPTGLSAEQKQQRNPFYDRLREGFPQRFAAARAELPSIESQEASQLPFHGLEILPVENSAAVRAAGLKPGDTILELNGEPWWIASMPPAKSATNTILYCSEDGAISKAIVPGADLAIEITERPRVDLKFLRDGQRNAEWDELVYVGLRSYLDDPELAETAWFHAVKKGYKPDAISDYALAEILFARVIMTRLKTVLDRMPPAALEHPEYIYPVRRYRMLLACGNYRKLAELLERWSYLAKHKALSGQLEHVKNLSENSDISPIVMSGFKQRDITAAANVSIDWETNDWYEPRVQLGESIGLYAPPGHYQTLFFTMPGACDVEWDLSFWCRPNKPDPKWPTAFSAHLLDTDDRAVAGDKDLREKHALVGIDLFAHTNESDSAQLWFTKGGKLPFTTDDPHAVSKRHSLRLLRARGRCELWLDDKCLILAPDKKDAGRSAFFLMVIGLEVNIAGMRVYELTTAATSPLAIAAERNVRALNADESWRETPTQKVEGSLELMMTNGMQIVSQDVREDEGWGFITVRSPSGMSYVFSLMGSAAGNCVNPDVKYKLLRDGDNFEMHTLGKYKQVYKFGTNGSPIQTRMSFMGYEYRLDRDDLEHESGAKQP